MEIQITKEDKYISVKGRVISEISYDQIEEIWKEIINACDEYQCFNILGVSEIGAMSISTAFEHEKIFREVGVTSRHRIAWVEMNSMTRESAKFAETVLKNRGLINGGLFSDVAHAKEWLFNEEEV